MRGSGYQNLIAIAGFAYIAKDTKIGDAEHRHLRVHDARGHRPRAIKGVALGVRVAHQTAPGMVR
jgi:hypothetical protein